MRLLSVIPDVLSKASFGLQVLLLLVSVLCVSVHPCIDNKLVCAITRDLFKLGPPNLRSLLFRGRGNCSKKITFNACFQTYVKVVLMLGLSSISTVSLCDKVAYYTPRTTKLLGGYIGFTPSVRPSVRLSVRPSVRPSVPPAVSAL